MRLKNLLELLLLGLTCLTINSVFAQQNFYAYHTKVVHSSTDYFGKYADLIVVLGEGRQLEFTRRTQYLPKWVTPKGSYLMDDFFPGRDADHEFNYNYVRLIEESKEKVVVHWRYIPDIGKIDKANANLDPTFIHGFSAAVHEMFTIYPSGKVEREVRDARGSNYDSWNKPDYGDRQTLQLNDNGIVHGSVAWGDKSPLATKPVAKSPIISTKGLVNPILSWTFDEGGGNYPSGLLEAVEDEPESLIGMTVESVYQEFNPVRGHGAMYKKGVSGTSMAFDGYYTGVQLPDLSRQAGSTYYRERAIPQFDGALSVEAWIAIDAYPYNSAPIIHHSNDFGMEGFYFGIDPYGYLLMTVNGVTVKSPKKIELYRWTYVAAVLNGDKINLYVDGELVNSGNYEGKIEKPETDFMIGLNTDKARCTDYVRSEMQNIEFIYGIQGLLDEVKVYGQSLSEDQVSKNYSTFLPSDLTSPLEKAVLPGEVGIADKFGASYKNLKHHELWDKMWRLSGKTDVVVKFDNNPASVVYWHGTNFAANWVTDNNRWMADQSSEIFTKHGCSEHMADKQTRHSYARIVESNDARVVIHWRYPCVDVGYICTDKRNWTDEYHTIYPDGTAVRKVVFNNVKPPGFQDIQFFTNPGETALDVVNINAMTVANIKGETLELVWEKPNKNPEQKLEDATIEWLNSKSDWKVFTVFQGPGISTWGDGEQSKYTDDPFAGPWNHWPVSLLPSDGRYAVAHDRVTHFALGANDNAPNHGAMIHYGFTDKKIDNVIPIARYWQNPPQITQITGGTTTGFNKEEKAYLLGYGGSRKMNFTIEASNDSPVINPAFVIEDANAKEVKLKWNGKAVKAGKELKIGRSHNGDGEEKVILWVNGKSEESVKIEIEIE